MKLTILAILAPIAAMVCACAGPEAVQMTYLNDKGWGRVQVLSSTAERRAVIGRVPGIGNDDKVDPARNIQVCAEPSPDVAEAISSSLRAVLAAAAGTGGKDSANLNTELMTSYATSLTTLIRRSQGVQMFRDGLYSLCQLHMNGALNSEELVKKYTELMEKTSDLVKLEMTSINTQKLENAELAARNSATEGAKQATIAKTYADESSKNAVEAKKAAEDCKAAAPKK